MPEPVQSVDLVALFGLAELESETEQIEFGSPEARSHLLEGWSFNQKTPEGRDFVWGLGSRSLLRIGVGEARDLRLRFRAWSALSSEGEPPSLEVVVAGQGVGSTPLRPGAAWYSVPIPGALLVPGENRIEFRYSAGEATSGEPVDPERQSVAFERLEVMQAASFGLPEVLADAEKPVLRVPFRSSLAYYWRLPLGGELAIESVRTWPEGAPPGRLEVEVWPASAAAPETVWLETGSAKTLSLPPVPAGPVRVLLRAAFAGEPGPNQPAEPGPNQPPELGPNQPPELGTMPAGLDLVAPVLRTPAAQARGSGETHAAWQPPDAAAGPTHVFVYMIDTLRPDHLGAYGYRRPTSPHIDAFARDATLFVDAVAQSSWTRPAVASIFTGLHPPTHGVVQATLALEEGLPSLPEILQDLGYQTWGIITNGNVAPDFGFGRGFERYHYLREGQSGEMHQLSDRVNELLFGWLDARERQGPLFLYLHSTDPHSPYTPRSPFREKLAGAVSDPEAGTRAYMRRLQLGEAPERGAAQFVRSLYDAEIAFNDASFGAFIEKLKELDLYASSLIVLLSDHGEAFAEHGSWQHGTTLYEEVVAIPLVIKFPHGLGRGEVVTTTARQVDVLPTILEVLGHELPARLEGRSLLSELDGQGGPATSVTAFSHLARRRGEWTTATQGQRKLIRTTFAGDGSQHVRLFELQDDPTERSDVAALHPVWRGYLLSQLRHFDSLSRRDEEAPAAEIPPELRERLEALGYM